MRLIKRKDNSFKLKSRTKIKRRSKRYSQRFADSKLQTLRRENKKATFRILITILLALGSAAALGWIIYLVFFSETVTVQNIEILFPQSKHTVSEDQIEDAVIDNMGKNLVLVDAGLVEQHLMSVITRIKDVEVKKLPPGTMQITVWEYQRLGVVRQPLTGISYTINEAGRVLTRTGDKEGADLDFIIMTTEPYAIDQVMFGPGHLDYLNLLIADLRVQLNYEIDTITYDPLAQEAKIKVIKGPELWIDFTKDQKETLLDLIQALQSPELKDKAILYIDLRLPNGKIIYRLG
jgi:cell division septal protein FtsQ